MLDLKFIRQNPELIRKTIAEKKVPLNLDELLKADQATLDLKKKLQGLEEQRNSIAKQIPKLSPEERATYIAQGKQIAKEIESLKPLMTGSEAELQGLLYLVPMIPSPEAPIGASDLENVVIRKEGNPRVFDFTPRDHLELLSLNQWGEMERIAQVSGSRSYALKNELVFLEMALYQFAMNLLKQKGFTIISVPAMAREAAFYGTGHFPNGREQVYQCPGEDLYLTGTAEVIANSLHRNEILKESDLPVLYGAYSPCFRKEAGSSGKDTRGLIRVHQFMKLEQFVICKNDPEESLKWHQTLLKTSEEIVQALELPYQIVDVCTGDMGAGKVRQYDLEVWVPSEKQYRETHSCSSLYDWQSRRTQVRYRRSDGEMAFCHTLNNTAVATPRILVPLLENHQEKDGSVRIPKALQPYLGGRELL